MKSPKEDPEVAKQRQQARVANLSAISDTVRRDSAQYFRIFGGPGLSGGSKGAGFSSLLGK